MKLKSEVKFENEKVSTFITKIIIFLYFLCSRKIHIKTLIFRFLVKKSVTNEENQNAIDKDNSNTDNIDVLTNLECATEILSEARYS